MKWSKIIEGNREELEESIKEAERDSYYNTHMRFVVYIYEDGTVGTLEDVAGGNSYYMDGLAVYEACNQNLDVLGDALNGDLDRLIEEIGIDGIEDEYRKYAELEEDDDIDDFADFAEFAEEEHEEEYNNVYKKCVDWYMEDFREDDVVDRFLEDLENEEEY